MQEKIDKLNREKYIEFIKNLIINSEQYKRNIDSNSYVIALDSPWGTAILLICFCKALEMKLLFVQ